jgi:hypothetical protein
MVLNYNGAVLLRTASQLRRFSGSSRFTFVDNELYEKKDIKSTPLEEYNPKQAVQEHLIPFEHEPVIVKPKSYSLNSKVVSRKLMSFFHSKLAGRQVSFYTISFPVNTSDNVAFEILNIVLTRLRKGYSLSEQSNYLINIFSALKSDKWLSYMKICAKSKAVHQLKNYLWVSERQQNGTIHFHLVTSDNLNVIVFNHFVAAAIFGSKQSKINSDSLLNTSLSKFNGVDSSKSMQKVKDVTRLRKYITKYITKNKSVFTHFCWHCSRSISALFTSKQYTIDEVESGRIPIDKDYKSTCYVTNDYYTFVYYPSIDFSKCFADLIDLNNSIIDYFMSD